MACFEALLNRVPRCINKYAAEPCSLIVVAYLSEDRSSGASPSLRRARAATWREEKAEEIRHVF